MSKIKLESFDSAKIGSSVSLSQIKGGTTYKQTGWGASPSGSTYKDWERDSGTVVTGVSCNSSDTMNPWDLQYT